MSIDEVGEYVTVLCLEGGDHGDDALHEPAAGFAVGSEAPSAPDYRSTQLALGEVVGRGQSRFVEEAPHGVLDSEEVATHGARLRSRPTRSAALLEQPLYAFPFGGDALQHGG